ncbi:MAG TPA: enoyl-CoA hydratase-related protein [Candidatus Saccharimonadales bacterium]|nr:enoyl-CoA hydratase-related protein [Candidatus Saccharimonadales bacterium]
MSTPVAGGQVRLAVEDHVARVELDRPPVNALNRPFVAELREAAVALGGRPDVWVVVVTSRQRAFSAGADLKERAAMPEAEVLSAVEGIQGLIRAWGEVPQPVLMGLEGAALGGGLELALTADLLAAAEGVKLGLPEVGLGIIPAAGGMQRLALRASLGVARKWVLSAQPFTAREALADGVVDAVFPARTFRDDFEQLVRTVAGNAPLSLRQAKSVFARLTAPALQEGAAVERRAYEPLVATADRQEALRAFAEKRPPRWGGK